MGESNLKIIQKTLITKIYIKMQLSFTLALLCGMALAVDTITEEV